MNSTYCSNCYSKIAKKVERPTKEELVKEITSLGFVGTGKKYGVSDNAIRKWCKSYGLSIYKKDYK